MKHTTVCRILRSDGQPCGQQFTANALPAGTEISKQDRAFVEGLLKHIEKKHPEAFAEIQPRWILFLGFLTLRCFESQDPGVGAQLRHFTEFMDSIAYRPAEIVKSA